MMPKHIPSEDDAHGFAQAAFVQAQCQAPWCGRTGIFDPHHIVEKKELKKRGLPLFDPRNALRLCPACHANQTSHFRKLPLSCVNDTALAYAIEALGAYVTDYLRRHYEEGDDGRLQALDDMWMEAQQ